MPRAIVIAITVLLSAFAGWFSSSSVMQDIDVPASAWPQYGALILFVILVGWSVRELRAFQRERDAFHRERDAIWQQFLKDFAAEDARSVAALVTEIKKMADEMIALRRDFDRAVTRMEERTRPRKEN